MKSRHRAHGFILVLTIWILAAISIAAAYFGERVQASLRAALARQTLGSAELALNDGRAEVLFRLATVPMTIAGLGSPPDVIRLDGRGYAESGGVVELQDAGGLQGLNNFSDEAMSRLLGTLGVPQTRHTALRDALRDYVDADDLRRLNGAEAAQYEAAGVTTRPRNAPLNSPLELYDVFGWAGETPLWVPGAGILDFTSPENLGRLNPNTAPWQVLTTLPGVTREVAAQFMTRRELQPIDAAWVDSLLGTQFDTLLSPIQNFPSADIRVTQRAPGLPWAVRYNVQLTPRGLSGPWKITYTQRLELPTGSGGTAPAAQVSASSSARPPSNAPTDVVFPPKLPPRPVQPASSPFAGPG